MIVKSMLSKAVGLCLLFLSSLCFSNDAQPMSEEERQARLKELKSTIEQLQSELKKIKSSRGDLLSDLESTESKIGDLSKKVNDLRKKLDNKQGQLKQLRSEKEALSRVKKQQQASVKQHLNAAYRSGQQSTLKVLLNQQDPATVSRNLHYLDRIVSAQANKIEQYTATLDRLTKLEPEIVQTQAVLQTHRKDLQSQRDVLVEKMAQRQRTLKKIDATLSSKDAQLAAMEKDRKDLESLLQRVVMVTGDMQVAVSNRPFRELKGKLIWPTQGRVVKNFGSQRVSGKIRWQGMMIDAKEGTPVHSIHHGRVVFSDYLRGHGLLLIIDHGDGFMSLYAHNQVLYKDIGDWVSTGEQIGSVGLSGGQKQAGLYFELRHKGKPTNPKPWLKKSA